MVVIHAFLQAYVSDVQLLPSPLVGNVDVLMDLLCISTADSTVKANYARFVRWKKGLLQMILTCWIYSQQIRFMLRFIYLL
jgi:hypothetical protein